MSYEETLDVSCMAVTPACSKGALGTWRSQCSARTLSRYHAALEAGTSSLVNRRGRCVCRSVLKLRRESGKTHEGKPRSEPDWGNPTVRDRRGLAESSCQWEPDGGPTGNCWTAHRTLPP